MIPAHLDVTTALSLPPGLHDFLVNNLDWLLRPSELSDAVTRQPSAAKRRLDCPHAPARDVRLPDDSASKRPRLAPLAEGLSDFDDDDDDDDDDDGGGGGGGGGTVST